MGRKRVYATNAERQRAYRRRRPSRRREPAPPPRKPARRPSRPARLAVLLAEAEALHQEYDGWLGALPEPLRDGDQAARLEETIERLEQVVELLAEIDPPRGFGRD